MALALVLDRVLALGERVFTPEGLRRPAGGAKTES